MISKAWIAAGIAAFAVALACGDPLPTDPDNPQRAATPAPNPDTGPGGRAQRTPAPVAADPNPEDVRKWRIQVAWAPTNGFVEIEWRVGSDSGGPREYAGPSWDREGTTWKNSELYVSAKWTELTYRELGQKNTTGSIIIRAWLATPQGWRIICDESTPLSGNRPRGTQCRRKL